MTVAALNAAVALTAYLLAGKSPHKAQPQAAGEAVPALVLLDAIGTTTFAAGCLLSHTVKVAVAPRSVVVKLVGVAAMPGIRLLTFTTETSLGFRPL